MLETPFAGSAAFPELFDPGRPSAEGETSGVLLGLGDVELSGLMASRLRSRGFVVHPMGSPGELMDRLSRRPHASAVIDEGFSAHDILDLCRECVAFGSTPVILLTGTADAVLRIAALEVGADDCMSSDGDVWEIVARIKAITRRARLVRAESTSPQACLEFSGWELERATRRITAPSGRSSWLSEDAMGLLMIFLDHAGECLSWDDLARFAPPFKTRRPGEVNYRARLVRLRRLLKSLEPGSTLIENVHGDGYVLTGRVDRTFPGPRGVAAPASITPPLRTAR